MVGLVPIDFGGGVFFAEYFFYSLDHVLNFLQAQAAVCISQTLPSSKSVR